MSFKLAPAKGFVVARLRIQFGRHSWTEKHFYGHSESPRAFTNLLNWHCFLRSTWLGTGASIIFASLSDMGSGKDGVAASNLPYTNPYPGIRGPIGDPDAGYQYRLEPQLAVPGTPMGNKPQAHSVYYTFRGVPAAYISSEAIIAYPYGLVLDPNGVINWLPNLTATAPSNNNLPPNFVLTAQNQAGTKLVTGTTSLADVFVAFLRTQTYGMTFTPNTLPLVPRPAVNAGVWTQYQWGSVYYRRIAERRAGGIFGQPKGRFSGDANVA